MAFRKCLFFTFFASLLYAIVSYILITKYFYHSPKIQELRVMASSLYMWIPGIFALIFAKKEGIQLKILQPPTRFALAALLIPVALALLGALLNFFFASFSLESVASVLAIKKLNFFKSEALNLSMFVLYMMFFSMIAAVTLNFLFSLGEELLWRGYLFEKLKCLGFYKASGIIGFLWGLWHAPIILLFGHNYPEFRIIGILMMIGFCILASPIFTYLRLKDNSLMAPTILHGMLNAFTPLALAFFPKGKQILLAPVGFAGLIALGIVNLYFFSARKKKELKLTNVSL